MTVCGQKARPFVGWDPEAVCDPCPVALRMTHGQPREARFGAQRLSQVVAGQQVRGPRPCQLSAGPGARAPQSLTLSKSGVCALCAAAVILIFNRRE